MKKKGFTLVELLAVIVVLGIILAIATSSVFNVIKTSSEKVKYAAAKEIVEVAESYMEENNVDIVSVGDLCDGGYLEDNATNPRTGKNDLCVEDKKIAIAKLNANFCDGNVLCNNSENKISFPDGTGYKIGDYGIIIEKNNGKALDVGLTATSFDSTNTNTNDSEEEFAREIIKYAKKYFEQEDKATLTGFLKSNVRVKLLCKKGYINNDTLKNPVTNKYDLCDHNDYIMVSKLREDFCKYAGSCLKICDDHTVVPMQFKEGKGYKIGDYGIILKDITGTPLAEELNGAHAFEFCQGYFGVTTDFQIILSKAEHYMKNNNTKFVTIKELCDSNYLKNRDLSRYGGTYENPVYWFPFEGGVCSKNYAVAKLSDDFCYEYEPGWGSCDDDTIQFSGGIGHRFGNYGFLLFDSSGQPLTKELNEYDLNVPNFSHGTQEDDTFSIE